MNKRLYLTNSLTPKELEVLFAIVEKGIFNRNDLARYFSVASTTINTHLENLYGKFQAHSMAELVYRYYHAE